jgi:hypothetical protein
MSVSVSILKRFASRESPSQTKGFLGMSQHPKTWTCRLSEFAMNGRRLLSRMVPAFADTVEGA